MSEKKNNDDITDLIEIGSDITGSVAGSVIGTIIAGPPGAILGGVAGPIITRFFKKIGSEIRERVLSDREETRIGATFTYALYRISERIRNGNTIRNDGFFESTGNNRAASEEILEGVLLVAQKEHEELKLKFLGNLIANIAFDNTIDRAYANFLIRTAEKMSYRQYCIVSLYNKKQIFSLYKRDAVSFQINTHSMEQTASLPLASIPDRNLLPPLQNKPDLSQEMKELDQWGIIYMEYALMKGYASIETSSLGTDLCRLMELDKIEKQDMDKISQVLLTQAEAHYA